MKSVDQQCPTVVFVQEAPESGGGPSANSRRKADLLREVAGNCTVIALDVRRPGVAGRLSLLVRYLGSIRAVATCDVFYGRLVPRVLPLALFAALSNRRVVLEANGRLLEDIGLKRLRPVVSKVFSWLVRRSNVAVGGDNGHRAYYERLWREIEWQVVPLGLQSDASPVRERVYPMRIVFAGALTQAQGIFELIDAFGQMKSVAAGAELHIFGSGPAESKLGELAQRQDGVVLRGLLDPASLQVELLSAGVLVAPYPWRYLPQDCISSLKVLESLMTDRPVVVPARESAVIDLGFDAADGVFAWDGRDTVGLERAMVGAVAAAQAGSSYPERRLRLEAQRGRPAQLQAVADFIEAPQHRAAWTSRTRDLLLIPKERES